MERPEDDIVVVVVVVDVCESRASEESALVPPSGRFHVRLGLWSAEDIPSSFLHLSTQQMGIGCHVRAPAIGISPR